METLFNKNIIFIFFFAMIAIYNYSDLKEYQRMAIIYISGFKYSRNKNGIITFDSVFILLF